MLFVFVHVFVAALKFSLIRDAAVFEFEVAEEVRFTDPPAQISDADVVAVTDVGVGFTITAWDV